MKRLFLAATCLIAAPALAQSASMQSPAYQECAALANSNPTQALAKADAWMQIDAGIAAQHCRAMALYGLHRFPEAADALNNVRNALPLENITLRSYVTRQAARAYINANQADRALALLNAEMTELGNTRGDNANASRITAELLLDRARLNETYGKLDEAAKDLDHAVSLAPVNQEVLLERASVFEKLGDKPLAKSDVDAVLTINSGNAQARVMRDRLTGGAATIVAVPSNVAAPQPVAAPADASVNNAAAPFMGVTASQNPPDPFAPAASTSMVTSTVTTQSSETQSDAPVPAKRIKHKKPVVKKTTTTVTTVTTPPSNAMVTPAAPTVPLPLPDPQAP